MCQSINENNNIFQENENDSDSDDTNNSMDDMIMSSKYQYIDEYEEYEEMDIFDFNIEFVNKITRETRDSIDIISLIVDSMNECYEFNNDIEDYIHQSIDDTINYWTFEDCEKLLYNYGIRKGIKEYTDEYGELDLEKDNWIKCVVYCILKNNMIIRIEEVDENNRDVKKIKSILFKTHNL